MFLIYNTMAFAVAQRRREIGVYRAIGMTQTRVAILFLIEAGVLGLVGGAMGSATGFILARQLTALLSRTISDLYIPVGPEGGDGLASGWFWTLSLEGLAVGCLVSMVGAIGPSLDAGRTAPARALAPGDYEAGRRLQVGMLSFVGLGLLAITGALSFAGPVDGVPLPGYLATLCLLVGLSCIAPICISGRPWSGRRTELNPKVQGVMREIAIDHASRNPGRNGVTVSALMVG
jgi:putative ABC transport system permease protein